MRRRRHVRGRLPLAQWVVAAHVVVVRSNSGDAGRCIILFRHRGRPESHDAPSPVERDRTNRHARAFRHVPETAAPFADSAPRSLRRKHERPEAIILLKEALRLEPTLFAPRLDLARLLARQKQAAAALALLEPMLQLTGGQLRQVRWTLLCISPGPGTGWRWLRATLLGR